MNRNLGDGVVGHIIKGYSGFYYVFREGKVYECSLRGKNRQKKVRFLPGDAVEFSVLAEDKGVIESVCARKNELTRPPVANIDQVVITVAVADPAPDLWLLDRLTVLALWNEITPVICFNKGDLLPLDKRQALEEIYRQAGFQTLVCSTQEGWGVEELKSLLKGKISVLAGNSGVGKSSLMNALGGAWSLATGEVSEKLKRGRHTTRHVELFALDEDTLVADTPGFSSLELPQDLTREMLSKLFPEMMPYLSECRFATCLHDSEPDCAVKAAVAAGRISESRYAHYREFLKEVIAQERRY